MSAGPTTQFDAAAEILAVASDALSTTPAGRPTREFVSISDPPYDCCDKNGMLTVHLRQVDKDLWSPNQAPGDQFHRLVGGSVNLSAWVITALRCVKTWGAGVKFPSSADMTADALVSYTDGWVLYNYVQARIKDGTLLAGFPCRDLRISPLLPVNPQGGCAGYVLILIAHVDGYVPAAV